MNTNTAVKTDHHQSALPDSIASYKMKRILIREANARPLNPRDTGKIGVRNVDLDLQNAHNHSSALSEQRQNADQNLVVLENAH